MVAAGTLAAALDACIWPTRTPCVYEIPEGFRGWVLIEVENLACPMLPKRDGKLIFSLSDRGVLCTSSKLEEGWATDTYFFVGQSRTPIRNTGWGGGGLIWGGSRGECEVTGKPAHSYESFFVGSEDEFKSAPAAPEPEACRT